MDSGEKRAHGRTVVRMPARVRCSGGAELTGTIENLGALGALVSSPDFETHFEVGDRVEITIERPDGETVEVEGEILRLEQEFVSGDLRRVFAVRFEGEFDAG